MGGGNIPFRVMEATRDIVGDVVNLFSWKVTENPFGDEFEITIRIGDFAIREYCDRSQRGVEEGVFRMAQHLRDLEKFNCDREAILAYYALTAKR